MILFESNDYTSLDLEFKTRSNEISIEVLKKICNSAYDKTIDRVVIGVIPNLNFELVITRNEFISSLEKNIPRAEESEEYELCSKAIECINYLKSGL